MTTYLLKATHLPIGDCQQCDTVEPDIKAILEINDLYIDFDTVYSSSVLLIIQMFPELFIDLNRKITFGLHFDRSRTAGVQKIRIVVVMWMKENHDVEYYIDKIPQNTILTYDQKVDILKKYGVPEDMKNIVDLMKRTTRYILYPRDSNTRISIPTE